MRNITKNRPFDGFKTAITDPAFFFGRLDLIDKILVNPSGVHVLIGGRRIGKTSALRAVEWSLLSPAKEKRVSPFPVYIALDVEQPTGLENFRYILIRRLRDAIERWTNAIGITWRERYRSFLRQISGAEVSIGSLMKLKLENPEQTRRLAHEDFREALIATLRELKETPFEGVVFILDEAEYIVRRSWANDAWSYLRGLKDSDTAIKPFLGILIGGYRDVKEYTQSVGSPLLNIADVTWLSNLQDTECALLIEHRGSTEGAAIDTVEAEEVKRLSGGHPFLVQQILNVVLDDRASPGPQPNGDLTLRMLRSDLIGRTFAGWWNRDEKSDGFRATERRLYLALVDQREASVEGIARATGLSWAAALNGMEVLAGTGVARLVGEQRYTVGAALFRHWVSHQSATQLRG